MQQTLLRYFGNWDPKVYQYEIRLLLALNLKIKPSFFVSGDREYSRPGLTISGAISLAVEEVNRTLAKRGHQIYFIVEETFGEEIISVQKTADLWTRNVSAYIGPQETCEHEAFMASAFNVPMISYVSNWQSE